MDNRANIVILLCLMAIIIIHDKLCLLVRVAAIEKVKDNNTASNDSILSAKLLTNNYNYDT